MDERALERLVIDNDAFEQLNALDKLVDQLASFVGEHEPAYRGSPSGCRVIVVARPDRFGGTDAELASAFEAC